MQSQITRILSSTINTELLSSLQTNQQQISKLEKILNEKNTQVLQLHSLINTELQTTMIENAKLKELSKSVLRVLREVKGEVCGVRRVVGEFWGNWGRVNGEFMKSLEKKIKEYLSKRQQNNIIPSNIYTNSKNTKKQQSIQTQKQKQPQYIPSSHSSSHSTNQSNIHLLQRLKKLEQTVFTLKQQKWSLQKQLKKYQTMYQSTTSPEKQYSSIKSLNQQQKRTYIVKYFQSCFQGLQEKKYCGEMIGNKKNGKGLCQYLENFVYEGCFVGGLRNGIGEMRFQGDLVYRGYWKNGRPSGKGCLYYFSDSNIQKYCGFFNNGVIQGYGTIYFQNGQKLRGQFVKGKIIGVTLMQNEDGSKIQYSQGQLTQVY